MDCLPLQRTNKRVEINHERNNHIGFLFALRGSIALDSRAHVSWQLVLRANRPRNPRLREHFECGV